MQSTQDEQATGTTDHPYGYEITVENNKVNATDNVIVHDTIPDGIEFLGITSGHTCTSARDAATGVTQIECNLGTLGAAATEVISYDAGIRYDYFGTANGGTNRAHDDFGGSPTTGTPIADKASLTNTASLEASYLGTLLPSQEEDATVVAAYATLSKTSDLATGENTNHINYTLRYTASEYYDIIDEDVDDNASSMTIHDLLPDGLTYITTPAASPLPTSAMSNIDGTTDLYWNSSVLDGLGAGSDMVVTFAAQVSTDFGSSDPVRAGDNLINKSDVVGTWDDQVDVSRPDGEARSTSEAEFALFIPGITKEVEDQNAPGTWISATDATIGDRLNFRVRYNTTDGLGPTYASIRPGSVSVTDWLPRGMTYVGGSAVESFSDVSDFAGGGDPTTETTRNTNGLDGVDWFLGDVEVGGWWQATFSADVDDASFVYEGARANNLWKMGAVRTDGSEYSDRDSTAITFREPILQLTKSASDVPDPPAPGRPIEYTISIENIGGADARDVVVLDTLDAYVRDTVPTLVSVTHEGANLSAGVDYVAPTFNSGSGEYFLDLHDGGVGTDIAPGEVITIVYTAIPDTDVGAGRYLENIATVSYNSQSDGSGRTVDGTNSTSDLNTDSARVDLPEASIEKTIPAGPYTVGDELAYTLRITVPEGQKIYWTQIVDIFDRDGVSYVSDSAKITLVSGSPVTAAGFDPGNDPDPIIDTSTSDETKLTWYFDAPIDNIGQSQDYIFDLSYNVLYDGIEDDGGSWEFFLPTDSDQVGNIASIAWRNAQHPTRETNESASDTAQVDIDQPLLTSQKTLRSAGPYNGSAPVPYRIVVENTGTATAYDVTLEDVLPTAFGSVNVTEVTHSDSGVLTSSVGYLANFGSSKLTMDMDGGSSDTHLAPGESLTIDYDASFGNDVGAGATLTNTVDVDWSSRDGDVVGERIYSDSAQEATYTSDTTTQSIMTPQATFEKSIITPVSGFIDIGNLIQYRLRVSVPAETVLYDPELEDVIDAEGLVFESGSLLVVTVSGQPDVAAAITATPVIDRATPSPGQTMTFDFDADIDNAHTDAGVGDEPYIFDVLYSMRVTGLDDAGDWLTDPSGGFITANTATFVWSDGNDEYTREGNASVQVVKPSLKATKTFDVMDVAGSDIVEATVVVENTGDGTAYEYDGGADFTDTMPSGFRDPNIVSVTHSTHGLLTEDVDYIFSVFGGNDFTLEYISSLPNLAQDETLSVVYTVEIDPDIGSGADISNSVDVDYSSAAGPQAHELVFDDGNPVEGTEDESTENVVSAQATFAKDVSVATREVTIGQEFDFTLTATIPSQSTLYNAQITDVIPDGLSVVNVTQSPEVGSVTISPEEDGETSVLWDMGDLAQTTAAQPKLTVTVRVDESFDDGVQVDGLPIGVDGDAQDQFHNTGELVWESAPSDGLRFVRNDDVSVEVIEASPQIIKEVDDIIGSVGDKHRFSLTLENTDGTDALRDITLKDILPESLVRLGVSPAVGTISHSVEGALVEGVDFTVGITSNLLEIDFANHISLAPHESLSVVYDVIIQNSAPDGQALINTASFVGHSERSGDNGDDLARTYSDDDHSSITVALTSISGTVWFDLNQDGIQDGGTEVGLDGIAVHLEDSAGNPVENPHALGTPYTLETMDGGQYVFANMATGDYRVRVELPEGRAFSEQDTPDDERDSDVNAQGVSHTVSIVPGDHVAHIDSGIVGARIGEFVWHDIDGNGLQDIGESGLEGVAVYLRDAFGETVTNPFIGEVYVRETNGDGRYSFEYLPAGKYTVHFATPTGYYSSPSNVGDETLESDGDQVTGTTEVITVGVGGINNDTDHGFYISHSIGNRVFWDRDDSGRDESESGISGVSVQLRDALGGDILATETTDADGYYLFTHLLPGEYRVFIQEQSAIGDFVSSSVTVQNTGTDLNDDGGILGAGGWSSDIITITTGGETLLEEGGKGTLSDPAHDENSNASIDFGFVDLSVASASLSKMVYEGHDGGAGCNSDVAKDELVVVDKNGFDRDLTYCFTLENTGPLRLGAIELSDPTLSITQSDMTLLIGTEPVMGGSAITYYYETVSNTSIENTATADMRTVDHNGAPLGDRHLALQDDALFIYVVDPPVGIKTGTLEGKDIIKWTMTWFNDSKYLAENVVIVDQIPEDTTYVGNTLICTGKGITKVKNCVYYEPDSTYPRGHVRVVADIGPDPGQTDFTKALNDLEISLSVLVTATGETDISNQAELHWDPDGDGANDFRGVLSDDPAASTSTDPSVITTSIADDEDDSVDIERQKYRPESLTIICTPQDTTIIRWNDKAEGENGYVVERKDGNAAWKIIALLPKNSEAYEDTSLSAVRHYAYRVSAFHGDKHTPYSIAAEFTVPSGPPPESNMIHLDVATTQEYTPPPSVPSVVEDSVDAPRESAPLVVEREDGKLELKGATQGETEKLNAEVDNHTMCSAIPEVWWIGGLVLLALLLILLSGYIATIILVGTGLSGWWFLDLCYTVYWVPGGIILLGLVSVAILTITRRRDS